MASNNLLDGTATWAACAGQVLHIGTATLSSGAAIKLGNGDPIGLLVWPDAIGVMNSGGFRHKIITGATAPRTLTLPDADLNLAALVTLLNASTTVQVTAAQTDNTAAAVNITGANLPLAINKTYLVEGIIVLSATAVGNGFRLDFTGASGATESGFCFVGGGTTADTNLAGNYTNNASPIANSPFAVRVTGYIKTGGTVGTDLQARFWTETAGQVLTMKFCRLTLTPIV